MISIINDTIKLVDELTEYLCALRENGYAISLCRLDPIFYAVFPPESDYLRHDFEYCAIVKRPATKSVSIVRTNCSKTLSRAIASLRPVTPALPNTFRPSSSTAKNTASYAFRDIKRKGSREGESPTTGCPAKFRPKNAPAR